MQDLVSKSKSKEEKARSSIRMCENDRRSTFFDLCIVDKISSDLCICFGTDIIPQVAGWG